MSSSLTDFTVPDNIREQLLEDDDPDLMRHVKRPQWGLAILAWERGDRRAYQFEDGRQRIFKAGYYDLLEPAQSNHRSEEAVIADLQAAIGTGRSTDRKPLEPSATFEQQVELFRSLYPEGFQGEEWKSEHRGTEGRSLKRHRDHVVVLARETLSEGAVATMMAEARYTDLRDAVVKVLASTNLVSLRPVKVLRELDDEATEDFAVAVAELLHGEGDFGPRFKAWVRTLTDCLDGTRPSWRLATALPALMDPEKHVCVRHSAFIRQAASIAPTSHYSRRPTARSYRNFRRVARVVRTRLEAAELPPTDLLDVHDFVWTTLRDSALDTMGDD